MSLGIASDHGGYKLKESLKEFLKNADWVDYGTNNSDSVDYPDYAQKLAKAIQSEELQFGVLICGTGIGISIAANRVREVRAALCTNRFMAKMAREHNNAQILVLGGRNTSLYNAIEMVEVFCNTTFAGGRHERRIKKIESTN
jgi:ribose 5-phosphate isomerase B